MLRGTGNQARLRYVTIDREAKDPGKRFVALYIDNVPGLTEFAAHSRDGLHWKTVAKIGDLRHFTGVSPTANPRYFLIEQRWTQTVLDSPAIAGSGEPRART